MKLGGIASGDDFYDRKTECADLRRYLKNDHVVASGPRRLGKSSIVNRLREQAAAEGILVRHVDVQGVEGAQAFVDELARHFPDESVKGYLKSMSAAVKTWFPAIKKLDFKGPDGIGAGIELQQSASQPWMKSAAALQARLGGAPVLIFIDEFSVFLQKLLESNLQEAAALLAWLRAWRVTPNVACRFLFTGSIGLNALLEKYGLSAQINDCFEYPIGPFKPASACEMLMHFANKAGWQLDVDTAKVLCDRTGWLSPYYLCLLLDQTIQVATDRNAETDDVSRRTMQLSGTDVSDAYERMLSARSRFVHWEIRLKRDLSGLDLSFTLLILTALAKRTEGMTLKQLHTRLAKLDTDPESRTARLQRILQRLQEEGYVSAPNNTGKIAFLSFLLRDYWARNHV
jgi:uncharacterized protein